MVEIKNIGILIFIILNLTACESLRNVFSLTSGRELTPYEKQQQEEWLIDAENKLNQNKPQEAQQAFEGFRKKFGVTPYYQRAQIGLAKSLEAQGYWSEAISLYKQSIEATRTTQPEIAAHALYQASFCYEALGDEARVMLSLKDALNFTKYLEEEIVLAEIPARLAASYFRQGRLKESQQKKAEAEKGLNQLLGRMEGTAWLARTYYLMGMVSVSQLSEETFQATIDNLKFSQKYTLRSVELGVPPWSVLATNTLISTYRDLWQVIENIKISEALDADAAEQIKAETQIRMAGEFLSALTQLQELKMPETKTRKNDYVDNLFWSAEGFQKKANSFLMEKNTRNKLTKESLQLRPLKQEVKLQDPQKPIVTEDLNDPQEKDPNLK